MPIRILVALAAILLLLFFTIQNPSATVKLQLFGWPQSPYPVHLSIVTFVCFAIGLVVGAMMKGGKKSGGDAKSG